MFVHFITCYRLQIFRFRAFVGNKKKKKLKLMDKFACKRKISDIRELNTLGANIAMSITAVLYANIEIQVLRVVVVAFCKKKLFLFSYFFVTATYWIGCNKTVIN